MDSSQQLGRGSRTKFEASADVYQHEREGCDPATQQILRVRYVREYEMNTVNSEYPGDHENNPVRSHSQRALSIFAENSKLKEELAASLKIIEQLRNELVESKNEAIQAKCRLEANKQEKKLRQAQFASELRVLLQRNQSISQEIAIIRAAISFEKSDSAESSFEASIFPNKLPPQQAKHEEHKRSSDSFLLFINSLQDMKSKIQGKRASSLQDLWRWLKYIGQQYSRHCKRTSHQVQTRNKVQLSLAGMR